MSLYASRRRANTLATLLASGAALFGLICLLLILGALFYNGLRGLTLDVFTQMTPPPGAEEGGLANAIIGSLIMVGLATLVGTPIGIFAGVMGFGLIWAIFWLAALGLLGIIFTP